ncbi:hypothetical protein DITRI_Ditri04bG0043200 [Diplodiscus trichospermus]
MLKDVEDFEDFGDHLIPVGYRFLPTDEELVTHYLINKVFCNPLPASVFQDIKATELYTKPPKKLVEFSNGEREWYFFYIEEENCNKEGCCNQKAIRIVVGEGLGFWQSNREIPIFDRDGNVLAFKIHFIYFSGHLSKAKKTHWTLDEYRLSTQFYTLHNSKEKWVLGRLRRGRDCNLD